MKKSEWCGWCGSGSTRNVTFKLLAIASSIYVISDGGVTSFECKSALKENGVKRNLVNRICEDDETKWKIVH